MDEKVLSLVKKIRILKGIRRTQSTIYLSDHEQQVFEKINRILKDNDIRIKRNDILMMALFYFYEKFFK